MFTKCYGNLRSYKIKYYVCVAKSFQFMEQKIKTIQTGLKDTGSHRGESPPAYLLLRNGTVWRELPIFYFLNILQCQTVKATRHNPCTTQLQN